MTVATICAEYAGRGRSLPCTSISCDVDSKAERTGTNVKSDAMRYAIEHFRIRL